MQLLLVDDEVTMLQIMQNAIDWNKIGIKKIYTACNAYEAKDIIESSDIDITICDIEMPGKSGLDLIRWMQDGYPEIINIILTGFPDFNYARSAISLGVFQYLVKPVAFEELEKIVIEAIERVEESKTVQENIKKNGQIEVTDPIQKVKKYLEEHYNEVVTRKNIESLVHMSTDYVNREFKKSLGYTLMEYMQYCRIVQAKKLLRETNLSMSDIGGEIGYDSPAYFAKIFKKQTSLTPSEYRAKHVK